MPSAAVSEPKRWSWLFHKEAQKLALFSSSGTLQLLLRLKLSKDAGSQQVVLTTLDLLGSGTGGWAGRSGTSPDQQDGGGPGQPGGFTEDCGGN